MHSTVNTTWAENRVCNHYLNKLCYTKTNQNRPYSYMQNTFLSMQIFLCNQISSTYRRLNTICFFLLSLSFSRFLCLMFHGKFKLFSISLLHVHKINVSSPIAFIVFSCTDWLSLCFLPHCAFLFEWNKKNVFIFRCYANLCTATISVTLMMMMITMMFIGRPSATLRANKKQCSNLVATFSSNRKLNSAKRNPIWNDYYEARNRWDTMGLHQSCSLSHWITTFSSTPRVHCITIQSTKLL